MPHTSPTIAPYRNSIDLVLNAEGLIVHLAAKERTRTDAGYREEVEQANRRRDEDLAEEQRRHRAEVERITRRHKEDVQRACARHAEFVGNIESTKESIFDLARRMAAQLSVVGYPRQATPELIALAEDQGRSLGGANW